MLIVHRAEERGREDHGWLDSRHTFNFGPDYDAMRMPYGPLRVLNEERLAPGHGYPRHQHADVEILTYLLEGALQHQDNLGHAALLTPGDVQRLTAGLGVIHTEVNPSELEPCRFLQNLDPAALGRAARRPRGAPLPLEGAARAAAPHRLARRQRGGPDAPAGRADLRHRPNAYAWLREGPSPGTISAGHPQLQRH